MYTAAKSRKDESGERTDIPPLTEDFWSGLALSWMEWLGSWVAMVLVARAADLVPYA